MMQGLGFKIPQLQFEVVRNLDASISWTDTYEGKKVRAALPINDWSCCIILLDADVSEKFTFKNLFCVDRQGNRIWTAKLPETHDAFVHMQMDEDGLHA